MRFSQKYLPINNFLPLFLLWANCLFAQNTSKIPSLKKQLAAATSDSCRSRLLYELGQQYEEINTDSCFYFLNQSLQTAQKSNNPKAIAQAMFGMGFNCIYYSKDETKAIEWLNKAIAVAKKSNDNLNLARAYMYLGVIAEHQHIGNPHDLYIKALSHSKLTNDWEVQVNNYMLIFTYFIMRKQYQQAESPILKTMEISQKHDIDEWFSSGLDYCDLLESEGKYAQANVFYKKLDAAKNKLKQSKGYFVYMNDVGKLEAKLKNYDEAENTFLKILDFEKSKTKVDTFHLFHIFSNLKDLYVEQGDFKKAYQTSENYAEVRLWLAQKRQTQDSKLQMTQLKANLDLEKKEVKITLLETQKKEQLLFLIAALVVAALLVSFVVLLQRNRQRIERQKTELGKLNTTKDKLFAILSHDLRSPVGSLKNYMMLINWGALSQKEFAESTQLLNTQLNNVQNMLDNVLNWSISQMGGMKPKMEKAEIFMIIENEIQLLKSVAEAKNISIENQIPPEVNILADKNHLAVIFRNLLQNALKFTNSGGVITFIFTKNENFTKIEVKDNGVGMVKERLEKLFYLDKSNSDLGTLQEQGTGLGLVLVKELVEINDGEIEVISEKNIGTIFTISFQN
jgi:signal transduction histidine kinase